MKLASTAKKSVDESCGMSADVQSNPGVADETGDSLAVFLETILRTPTMTMVFPVTPSEVPA